MLALIEGDMMESLVLLAVIFLFALLFKPLQRLYFRYKPYSKHYILWFLMNVVVGLMPIFTLFLDGKSMEDIFPSLLLVFVVMLASGTHMFLKQEGEIDADKLLTFSIALSWIIILLIFSTKYPYNSEIIQSLFSGISLIIIVVVLSISSILLVARVYYPFIESDVMAEKEKKRINQSQEKADKQGMGTFDEVVL